MDNTLETLLELQEEIELYCDPNEKVSAMLDRFIEIEEHFKLMREIN